MKRGLAKRFGPFRLWNQRYSDARPGIDLHFAVGGAAVRFQLCHFHQYGDPAHHRWVFNPISFTVDKDA